MNTNPVKRVITQITINYHKTASSSITDLTGTKWLINEAPENAWGEPYNISFTSNSQNFVALFADPDDLYGSGRGLKYFVTTPQTGSSNNFEHAYNSRTSTWSNQAYRTIEITGGTDATNSNLITWLQSNATQIEDEDPEPEPEPTPEPSVDKLITLDNLAVFKEEEDALLATKMANPMTTQGDLVVGGTNGTPTRLARGTNGQVLTAGTNGPEWTTPSVGLPTITIAASQVISQSPLQIQLTDEQYATMQHGSVIFDGSALGVPTVVADYNGSLTDDSDVVSDLEFVFIYNADGNFIQFNRILVNCSTKIANINFGNTYPKQAVEADTARSATVSDSTYAVRYQGQQPTSADTTGYLLKIAVLNFDPAIKYDGWLYIITESN